jgi:hypothetical protein
MKKSSYQKLKEKTRQSNVVVASCCPKCGAPEVEAMTLRTKYRCGSSDYDQRPGTFKQVFKCKIRALFNL